jgi:hypothetical protein
MAHCASRFEGDADGDGDVDDDDYDIWSSQNGLCSGGSAPAMAGPTNSVAKDDVPASADANGDGQLDEKELAQLDQAILGTDLATYLGQTTSATSPEPVREPTLAEPQADVTARTDAATPPVRTSR